jgi:hypothetical protein
MTLIAPVDHGNPRANARELTRFLTEAKTELTACGGKASAKLNVKAKPTKTKPRTELPIADPSTLTTDNVLQIIGEDGFFLFDGLAKDGSVKVYGGTTKLRQYRAFKPERVLLVPMTATELKAQLRAKREGKTK